MPPINLKLIVSLKIYIINYNYSNYISYNLDTTPNDNKEKNLDMNTIA
jgi:hypothetical protein